MPKNNYSLTILVLTILFFSVINKNIARSLSSHQDNQWLFTKSTNEQFTSIQDWPESNINLPFSGDDNDENFFEPNDENAFVSLKQSDKMIQELNTCDFVHVKFLLFTFDNPDVQLIVGTKSIIVKENHEDNYNSIWAHFDRKFSCNSVKKDDDHDSDVNNMNITLSFKSKFSFNKSVAALRSFSVSFIRPNYELQYDCVADISGCSRYLFEINNMKLISSSSPPLPTPNWQPPANWANGTHIYATLAQEFVGTKLKISYKTSQSISRFKDHCWNFEAFVGEDAELEANLEFYHEPPSGTPIKTSGLDLKSSACQNSWCNHFICVSDFFIIKNEKTSNILYSPVRYPRLEDAPSYFVLSNIKSNDNFYDDATNNHDIHSLSRKDTSFSEKQYVDNTQQHSISLSRKQRGVAVIVYKNSEEQQFHNRKLIQDVESLTQINMFTNQWILSSPESIHLRLLRSRMSILPDDNIEKSILEIKLTNPNRIVSQNIDSIEFSSKLLYVEKSDKRTFYNLKYQLPSWCKKVQLVYIGASDIEELRDVDTKHHNLVHESNQDRSGLIVDYNGYSYFGTTTNFISFKFVIKLDLISIKKALMASQKIDMMTNTLPDFDNFYVYHLSVNDFCNQDSNYCKNNGKCVPTSPSTAKCECRTGYFGIRCQERKFEKNIYQSGSDIEIDGINNQYLISSNKLENKGNDTEINGNNKETNGVDESVGVSREIYVWILLAISSSFLLISILFNIKFKRKIRSLTCELESLQLRVPNLAISGHRHRANEMSHGAFRNVAFNTD